MELADRFWSKVDRSGECWIWTRAVDHRGYGRVRFPGRHAGAHRVSWELENGRIIPDGMMVCHTCDNPPCVRPDHLFLGTALDNQRDSVAKGRHAAPPIFHAEQHWTQRSPERILAGERHPRARLSNADVARLRQRRAEGATLTQLAVEFNVAKSHAGRIASGSARKKG